MPTKLKIASVPVLRNHSDFHYLQSLLGNVRVAGGYARYVCSPNPEANFEGDIDIVPRNQEEHDSICKTLRINCGQALSTSPCATTFKSSICGLIQVLGSKFFAPEETKILEDIDFTVCKVSISLTSTDDGFKGIADPEFLKHEKEKKLVVRHVDNPVGCLRRIMKYTLKGYSVDNEEILKIMDEYAKAPDEKRSFYKDKVQSIASRVTALFGASVAESLGTGSEYSMYGSW